MTELKLTPKQELFCQEYLVDLNAKQAAIRAGYSANSADVIGCENLVKPNVAARIQELQSVRANKLEISQERVLKEYARLAFVDTRNFFNEDGSLKPLSELDDDTAAALAGIDIHEERGQDGQSAGMTKKIKITDKKGALDSVARHLGMFNDSLELKLPKVIRKDLTGKKND